MKHKEDCGICGTALIYATDDIPVKCHICGKESKARIYCPQGHYICDTCHRQKTVAFLKQMLSSTSSRSPFYIAELIMANTEVPMHGPEHHAIVPTVIVAAVRNSGYPVPAGAIDKAIERGSKVPGGWCGFYGACGAAIGVGIAISILSEATPLTGKPRSLAMEATSYVLSQMVDGYPRCCKRASRQALEAAVKFLYDRMGIVLGKGKVILCTYSNRNLECPKEDCLYYKSS